MEIGVRYLIKHSGEFLFKITNEEDKMNFKVVKIKLPDKIKYLPYSENVKQIKWEKKNEVP